MLYTKFFGRMLVLLSAVALCLAFGIGSLSIGIPSAHAQTSQRALPATDSSACTPLRTSSHDVFCSGPSITTFCTPANTQFTQTTDGFKHLIDWTFLDHNNHCVTVTFHLSFAFSSCTTEFYVPLGNANAVFTYTWVDGFNGSTHTGTLNEAPVDGWQVLPSIFNATSLSFEDFQPKSPAGTQQIGWGANSTDGVRVTCG
jgi:hypothetical protein